METRLFGTLELRSTDDELREFEGIANTGAIDSHGTCIEPAGARFTLPMPLLFQHDQNTPVGEITDAQLIDGKWHVKGTIRRIPEAGLVRDAVDRAWHNIKYGLMRGLSIGFKPLKFKANRCFEWAWRELSIVTLPSNSETTILAVRSAYLAASGEAKDPASRAPNPNPRHGTMTIQEQITQHENSRAAKVARKQSLVDAAAARGETMNESEAEEFDTLDTEIRSIDGHLTRLSSLKRDNEVTPVVATSTRSASDSRGGVKAVSVKSNILPGLGFARYVMALAVAGGNRFEAAQYAKRSFGESDTTNEIVSHLEGRAAIAAGTTLDATFAAPLVQTNFLNEFLELLRPATLIGRIPGLKRVPFNISMPAQTAGGTYNWVGQGAAKPLTNMAFSTITLGMAKAAGIIVLTEELVRSSAPSAQEVTRDELVKGITSFLDDQFVDPAVAAVANVSPASITNGVAGSAASGTTAAAARTDIANLIEGFVTGNFGLGSVVLLMNEGVALNLGLMINTDGTASFPGINPVGGSLLGIPVVTSNVIGDDIFAVHAPSILVADDGGVDIAISREASLQMDSAPANPTIDTTVMVSLFQRNLVALRGERYINWAKARSTAVRRIHTVAYAA